MGQGQGWRPGPWRPIGNRAPLAGAPAPAHRCVIGGVPRRLWFYVGFHRAGAHTLQRPARGRRLRLTPVARRQLNPHKSRTAMLRDIRLLHYIPAWPLPLHRESHTSACACGGCAPRVSNLTALPNAEPARHAPPRPCMQCCRSGAQERRGGSRSRKGDRNKNCLSICLVRG